MRKLCQKEEFVHNIRNFNLKRKIKKRIFRRIFLGIFPFQQPIRSCHVAGPEAATWPPDDVNKQWAYVKKGFGIGWV